MHMIIQTFYSLHDTLYKHIHADLSPVQYLSVSWRSAEVIGCVLNLSEVFLLSPGQIYCLGLRPLSLSPLQGAL